MSAHIFTYGSLMFPPVWTQVVRGTYAQSAAVLAGHARFTIEGETYPGMIVAADVQVEGVVYFDVDSEDLQVLDAFEGADYQRVAVTLRLPDDTALQAWTYLYLPTQRLTSEPWLPAYFQLQCFLDSYCKDKLG